MRLSSKARTGALSPEWTSHVSRRRADRASEKVADVLDGLRLASVSWAVITSQPSVMAHGNGPRRRARLGWRGLQTDMESRHRPADLWDWVGPLYQLPPCLPDSAWSGHIPFLALLIRMAKPRTFVELGVWLGASFLAACEAAKIFDTGTRCFGVDTWRGDAHAGFFDGDPVFLPLSAFVAAHYPNAELIRASFEDALPRLADGSIDLLHIDGFHTYEAVSRDFRTWLPKLSPRGIVLFHDTEVRQADFGVWKLWGSSRGDTAISTSSTAPGSAC